MENIVYTDYANWLLEIDDLMEELKKAQSFLYFRYKHILDVLEYLYNVKIEKDDLSEDEDTIFGIGFNFMFEQYDKIGSIFKYTYDNNLEELHKQQKTIELLLTIHDFQMDIVASFELSESYDDFVELSEEVNTYIDNKEEAPETLFTRLDEISSKIYEEKGVDYYPISEIFYDIAVEYDLL